MPEQCSIHNLAVDRICGLIQCCRILCPSCFISHEMETGHHLAVRMCPQALTFFTHFTGFVQYKLLGWADAIRREGAAVFFKFEAIDQKGLEEIRSLCAEVLDNYAQLMRGNRQFVMANQDTPLITHPEFLKDLFNLVVESWATSAQVIVDNLVKKLEENIPGRYRMSQTEVQPHLMSVFEQERIQMLKRGGDILVRTDGIPDSEIENNSKGIGEYAIAEDSKESDLLQTYFPPWSIRKIESIEEITEKHQSSCSIKYDLPIHMQNPDPIRQTEDQHNCIEERAGELQEENQLLKDENELLKMERDELEAINDALSHQGQRSANNMPLADIQPLPVSSQTVLLDKIKQLQAQLADRQSDLSLLVSCLTELANRQPSLRSHFNTKLSSLRSIALRF